MISELFAKYQFGSIHPADITDGKVTNRASVLPNLRYSTVYTCPWNGLDPGCSNDFARGPN